MRKNCFTRETIFTLIIFSGLDLHHFHNRSLAWCWKSELFFYLLSHPNFINTVSSTHLSYVNFRIESSRIYTHTYTSTYTFVQSHVITPLTYCRLRGCWYGGMKRDGVAEEGKERTKRERLGSVCGVGVSVWVPQQPPLCLNIPPRRPSPSLRCCCCCCYHPLYAAWRWNTAWGIVVDQYYSGSRGCTNDHGTRIRRVKQGWI